MGDYSVMDFENITKCLSGHLHLRLDTIYDPNIMTLAHGFLRCFVHKLP